MVPASVATAKAATRLSASGATYCVAWPPGTAASAAASSALIAIVRPCGVTAMRSAPRPAPQDIQSIVRPVMASMQRKGMT